MGQQKAFYIFLPEWKSEMAADNSYVNEPVHFWELFYLKNCQHINFRKFSLSLYYGGQMGAHFKLFYDWASDSCFATGKLLWSVITNVLWLAENVLGIWNLELTFGTLTSLPGVMERALGLELSRTESQFQLYHWTAAPLAFVGLPSLFFKMGLNRKSPVRQMQMMEQWYK